MDISAMPWNADASASLRDTDLRNLIISHYRAQDSEVCDKFLSTLHSFKHSHSHISTVSVL